LIRKSASIAYAGIRMPLALVENRLPEDSRVRNGIHGALMTIDSSVGQLLHPARNAPSPRPDRNRDTAPDTAPDAAPDLAAEREAIFEAVRENQPTVGELADPDLDVADVQAQLQAKHALEEREQTT
jgi:hypothetical protein